VDRIHNWYYHLYIDCISDVSKILTASIIQASDIKLLASCAPPVIVRRNHIPTIVKQTFCVSKTVLLHLCTFNITCIFMMDEGSYFRDLTFNSADRRIRSVGRVPQVEEQCCGVCLYFQHGYTDRWKLPQSLQLFVLEQRISYKVTKERQEIHIQYL
jgi:hypothetical protein